MMAKRPEERIKELEEKIGRWLKEMPKRGGYHKVWNEMEQALKEANP